MIGGLASRESIAPSAFRWARKDDEYVIEWPDVLTLIVTARGEIRETLVRAGAEPTYVEKLRHGTGAAFARALVGGHSLHASAVSYGNGALLCVGASGAGKSTVAASLSERSGFELLADDILAIEEFDGCWRARPSESSVWLFTSAKDGGGAKVASGRPSATHAKSISHIVLLRVDDSVAKSTLGRVRGTHAAAAILSAFVRFIPTAAGMKREIEVAHELAAQAPIWTLTRPSVASVVAVTEQLSNLVGGNSR